MNRAASAIASVLLLLVGAFAWSFQLRDTLAVDADSLAAIPQSIDGWRGVDTPVDAVVESMLRADYNLQRTYSHTLGYVAWLYLGYYGTSRGGVPEHTPPQCYSAQGWAPVDLGELTIDRDRKLRVSEMLVEFAGGRRLVHYWYRSHQRGSYASTFGLRLGQVRSRLASGRADGALVRLSTPLSPAEDPVEARPRLTSLARALDEALDNYWPREYPAE